MHVGFASVYIYIYMCVCVYICICVHYICIYTYIHICIYTYIHTKNIDTHVEMLVAGSFSTQVHQFASLDVQTVMCKPTNHISTIRGFENSGVPGLLLKVQRWMP